MSESVNICCKNIRVGSGWQRHSTPCGRPGKVEVDGKHYCGIHDPVKRRVKQDQRAAERNAASERRMARYRLECAAPLMLEALESLVACISETRGPAAHDALIKAHAAIAAAKGTP